MKIKDRVYGEVEINEQVLIDLINCKSVQRLREINQFGMPDEYYHLNGFSRYEHSIGVMILLKKLGAGLKEQIAGLLHDVSHTAFSHLIDWVIGDPDKEDYQDNEMLNFVGNSEIPKILGRHGFDYREICEHENFSLLESNAPNLCADRVDYALREIFGFETAENINLILNGLADYKGKMVFVSKDAAEIFAEGYAKCQREHWAGAQAKARYYVFAKILRKALSQRIISMEDLWKTDYDVIEILKNSRENEIINGLNLLRNGFDVEDAKENKRDSIELRKKFRFVDPEILFSDRLKRLSEVSESYRASLEKQKFESQLVKKVRIVAK